MTPRPCPSCGSRAVASWHQAGAAEVDRGCIRCGRQWRDAYVNEEFAAGDDALGRMQDAMGEIGQGKRGATGR